MNIVFLTLWFVDGMIQFQPYGKAVDACLWASRVQKHNSMVMAIGFEQKHVPIIHFKIIDCREANKIDSGINFGGRGIE